MSDIAQVCDLQIKSVCIQILKYKSGILPIEHRIHDIFIVSSLSINTKKILCNGLHIIFVKDKNEVNKPYAFDILVGYSNS